MLALALLRIEIFFFLLLLHWEKSLQKDQSLSDSNNVADFNNVNKEFLQKNPPKKVLQKNSPKKIQENPKKTPQKNPE